jgi:hypothetical protein
LVLGICSQRLAALIRTEIFKEGAKKKPEEQEQTEKNGEGKDRCLFQFNPGIGGLAVTCLRALRVSAWSPLGFFPSVFSVPLLLRFFCGSGGLGRNFTWSS